MVIITIIEFLITLMAHSAFGIYSSTLKYNKRLTHLIWGIWILLQGSLFFYSEFILKSTTTQFLTLNLINIPVPPFFYLILSVFFTLVNILYSLQPQKVNLLKNFSQSSPILFSSVYT